jgi:hypothetical protein
MLRLKRLQPTLLIRSLSRARSVQQNAQRFTASGRKLTTGTACISVQKQNTRISTLWKTSAVLAASALTYTLTSKEVHALEATECNESLLVNDTRIS